LSNAKENVEIARAWLRAFNARDLASLVSLYSDDATHTSPKLRDRQPETGGRIVGKAALERWWADAFQRLPTLRYEEKSFTADDRCVVIEYLRHVPGEPPMPVAEFFEIRLGRIFASRVYHG
jgi:ketosteroid isomerase-like protein